MSLLAGTRLGPYVIETTIGSGGRGEVYRALDTRLDRLVALKVLLEGVGTDLRRSDGFSREARTAAALNHPNIVTLYSVEEVEGVSLLVMELVEGRSLSASIPPGGLEVDRFLSLAVQLADAVGAAHQRGIVHRDLKPANIMVTGEGRVKVLDFGLARLKAQVASAAPTAPPERPGEEGPIAGTIAYMSPEQAEGRPFDHRSDIFSLGIVFYKMLTGHRPFPGHSSIAILSSIVRDTPRPVTEVRPCLPRDLNRIVRRCLMKDPEQRYQSAKDLRHDLEDLRHELELEAEPQRPARPTSPEGDAPRRVRRDRRAGAGLFGGRMAIAVAGLVALAMVAYFMFR